MTPLRFLHLGDLHLGPNARNPDRIRAFDQVITEGLAMPLAAWLVPGDLNHSLMSVYDKNILTDRVIRMANHAPVVIVPGNHDTPGDLDFLAKLKAIFPISVVTTFTVLRVPLPFASSLGASAHEAAIFCFPYPTRMGLVAAGTPSDQIVAVARQALEHIFVGAADDLAAAVAEGCVPLMIGHVNVGGSQMSSGQPNIGKEIELDPTMLDRLGPIYKGLNHIHKAQEIGGAWYAGSVCRLDWGEVEEKRYLTIDYDRVSFAHKGGPDAVWHYTVESHPLDVAPMYHVEGYLTAEGFRLKEGTDPDIERRYHAGEWAGCEVRVRFWYVMADRALLDFAVVKAAFPGALRFLPDPIPTHTQAIRAPEVIEAVTFEGKVAAFVRGRGQEWTKALEEKLAMLKQLDGAAFFTRIAAELAALQEDDDLVEEPFVDDEVPSSW